MKITLLLGWGLAISLFSCMPNHKEDADQLTCRNIRYSELTSNSPVTIGESIHFGATEVGGYRVYTWTGPNQFSSNDPHNTISDARLYNEGWYYLELSNPSCSARIDSVYIDVKLQQGTAPCTIANNTCQFSNQATDNYPVIQRKSNRSSNMLTLYGNSANADITIFFHPHWQLFKEPKDGIYKTTPIASFEPLAYNTVFVTTTKSSIYWSSIASQDVYVSHVNGRLQVRFCGLAMSGTNGANSFTTQASGTFTEQ